MISDQYIAGFFDGEGSVGLYSTGYYHLRVCITQVSTTSSLAVLSELVSRFGGGIYKIGKMKQHHRTAVMWAIYGVEACVFLKTMEPHLLLKAAQARVAIDWQEKRDQEPKNSRSKASAIIRKSLRSHDKFVAERLKGMKRAA